MTNPIPTDALGQTIWFMERRALGYREAIEKFTTRLAGDDPLYAFGWGEPALDAAAKLRYMTIAIRFLTGEVNPDFAGDRLAALRDEWTRELARQARSQRYSSSSVMANVADEAKRVALAQLLEELPPAEPRLATDAATLRDAIWDGIEERRAQAVTNAMGQRTQKETRFAEGVARGFELAGNFVRSWRPKDE